MTLKQKTALSQDEMMQHCQDWLSSGINQKTFCKERGLSYSHFVSCRMLILKQEKQHKFKAVNVRSEANTADDAAPAVNIKLTFPNGIILDCNSDIKPQALKRMMDILVRHDVNDC